MKKSENNSVNFWNPFEKLAGFRALAIGAVGIMVSVFMGTMFNARFDGLLNLHFVANANLWLVLADQIINLLSISICFYIISMVLSLGKVRFIDVLGCNAFALSPMAILPVVNISGYWSDLSVEISGKPDMTPRILSNLDTGVMIFTVTIALIVLIWHILWLYNAYKVASGFKGKKLLYSFIAGLVGAIMLSKYLVSTISNASII